MKLWTDALLDKIKPELFGYLRASTISPKQAAAHQEMFFLLLRKGNGHILNSFHAHFMISHDVRVVLQ